MPLALCLAFYVFMRCCFTSLSINVDSDLDIYLKIKCFFFTKHNTLQDTLRVVGGLDVIVKGCFI